MRHAPSPSAIATGPRGVGRTAPAAPLVALTGPALPFPSRFLGTAIFTINLAPIAATTDEHLRTATGTRKEAAWLSVLDFWRVKMRAGLATMLAHSPYQIL
jgi:hypothetical protein